VVHLHLHTHFSFGIGVSSPEVLAAAAAERGHRALACTDTNGVYGAIEFQRACDAAGIRPILGAHLVTDEEETVALATDERGWGALCRAITEIHWKDGEDGEGHTLPSGRPSPSSPSSPSSYIPPMLPPHGRLLAVDWGDRRIGLALSDEMQVLATPLETLVRRAGKRFPMPRLLELVAEHRPVGVVVGLPLTGEGAEGASAGAARELAGLVERRTGLPLARLLLPAAVVGRVEARALEVDRDREQSLLDRPRTADGTRRRRRVGHLLEELERVPVRAAVLVDGHARKANRRA